MNKKNDNRGFSLVELIIVIAIMAILVGVLAPQFIKYVEQSRESTDLQNLEEYKTAIEAGVADGSITSNVTLTITGGAGGGIKSSADLTAYGLPAVATGTKFKSQKWDGTSNLVYNATTYNWTGGAGHADYYNLDGSKYGS